MPLELVELALSKTDVEVDHGAGGCWTDVGPFVWDIVGVFDLVGCTGAYRGGEH